MRHAIGGRSMNGHYLTAGDHERYLDNLAKSKAMCADKLRHGYCSKEQCASCEKKKLMDACEAELAPYSRLLLNDKTEIAIGNIIVAHPTLEEVEEKIESRRQTYREAFIQAQKDANWEWWHRGNWIYLVAIVLTPILVPLVVLATDGVL